MTMFFPNNEQCNSLSEVLVIQSSGVGFEASYSFALEQNAATTFLLLRNGLLWFLIDMFAFGYFFWEDAMGGFFLKKVVCRTAGLIQNRAPYHADSERSGKYLHWIQNPKRSIAELISLKYREHWQRICTNGYPSDFPYTENSRVGSRECKFATGSSSF